jgi:hypothetical protein
MPIPIGSWVHSCAQVVKSCSCTCNRDGDVFDEYSAHFSSATANIVVDIAVYEHTDGKLYASNSNTIGF